MGSVSSSPRECWSTHFPNPKYPLDAGDSGTFSSSFLRLSIFPVGRLRRPRPSEGWALHRVIKAMNIWFFYCRKTIHHLPVYGFDSIQVDGLGVC
jgi:hypothetical protein